VVARNDFIEEKRAPMDWFTPRPMPAGKYTLFYGDGEATKTCAINNTNGGFKYVCVPGFFQLINEAGLPTLTVSGQYALDLKEK
jgi:hypothetical protein